MRLTLRFWESLSYNPYLKRITLIVLIFGILVLAFTIRLQGKERIPDGQFTSNDAYLYYWQAKTISQDGFLPPVDEYRWAPNGRDNGQLLSLYAYVLAYTHKVVKMFFYDVSLYQVSTLSPNYMFYHRTWNLHTIPNQNLWSKLCYNCRYPSHNTSRNHRQKHHRIQ